MTADTPTLPDDDRYMAIALALAARGLGQTWPNPAVGCVIVKAGRIVGRGWTQPGGRPHAEVEAIARAGPAARGATAYVTLEPCAHHGATPPCSDALIEAGLSRVVFACVDPNPRVAGRGAAGLREAGIAVTEGVRKDQATALNAGFFRRIEAGRPLVTLKLATTLDGRIATRSGESKWITGERARAEGHLLRARHDAILVGAGTVIADDPALTCRLPGLECRSPVRVVLDSGLRIPMTAGLVETAREVPTWVVTARGGDAEKRRALGAAGVTVIESERGPDGRLGLEAALSALAAQGITRLLIEGGAAILTNFLANRLVDRLVWFRAPLLLGADGLAAVSTLGIDALAAAIGLRRIGIRALGEDVVETYMVHARGS